MEKIKKKKEQDTFGNIAYALNCGSFILTRWRWIMTSRLKISSITNRLTEISAQSDPVETLAAMVGFEMFQPVLEKTLEQPPR